MWRKLKKVDWTNGPIDLIVVVLFFVGLAMWFIKNDTAEAKIQEFNTITQTWTDASP